MKRPYPAYCCQTCGRFIGYIGRFMFPFLHCGHGWAATVRDWRRGYTDADASSLRTKLAEPTWPGKVINLTHGEQAAFLAGEDE